MLCCQGRMRKKYNNMMVTLLTCEGKSNWQTICEFGEMLAAAESVAHAEDLLSTRERVVEARDLSLRIIRYMTCSLWRRILTYFGSQSGDM